MDSAIIIMIAFVGLFFIQMLFFISKYKKCPPDKVMVIYGHTGDENNGVLFAFPGEARFIWPVIQDYEFLDLKPFHQEINTKFESKDLVLVPVELTVDYGISLDKNILPEASYRLLGKERLDIQNIAKDVISGAVKKVFSSNDLVTIATSKEQFLINMATNVKEILNKIGLDLFNIEISYLKNQNDYLKELEEKFKESKLANFDMVDQKEVEQQLDILNQKIEINAQERLGLVQEKLDLLAKLK